MNRLVLSRFEKNNQSFISYILLDENRKFVDFQLFNETTHSLINSIYVARVDKVVPGINAAFVTIGNKQNCYLPLEDTASTIYTNKHSKREGLCSGDEILVQVVKDAIKTKDPVVTTKISIFGNYSVVTTDDTSIGVSKKIPKETACEIRNKIYPIVQDHETHGYGIIVRTNAKAIGMDTLTKDIENAVARYKIIRQKADHAVLYTKLFSNPEPYMIKLYHLDFSNIDSVVTDQDDIYKELIEEFNGTDFAKKIKRYDDSAISLNLLYKLSSQIKELCSSQVWLNSGANIIIEQLETLSVIDVNSSKCATKKDSDILKINMEAATEAARQIRLRNISGMIIIDFINMKSKEDENALINHLKSELKKDSITCSFIDITKLGLIEITRKKEYKSLKETISSIQ